MLRLARKIGDQVVIGLPDGRQVTVEVLDLTGKTVMPGLVGMHEHLFYPTPGDGPGRQNMYG